LLIKADTIKHLEAAEEHLSSSFLEPNKDIIINSEESPGTSTPLGDMHLVNHGYVIWQKHNS
jgi:hypothetical protein